VEKLYTNVNKFEKHREPQMVGRFDPEQMQACGLDPMNMEDCAQWFVAEPEDPNKPIDYSDDLFEFGGKPRQKHTTPTGIKNIADGDCPTFDKCPVLQCVQKSVPAGKSDIAVELASHIIGAKLCPGNDYSLETATGTICRAPERGSDETGREVARIVSKAINSGQTAVQA
jgi:hypothetical protein